MTEKRRRWPKGSRPPGQSDAFAEARYGMIDGLAPCLVEDRQAGKVRHTLGDLLAQRIFATLSGRSVTRLGPPVT